MDLKEFEKRGLTFLENENLIRVVEFADIESTVPVYAEQKKSSKREDLPLAIYPVFRAMTGDKVTRNKTYYPKEELTGDSSRGTGLISWVYPYEVPVILNHLDSPGMMTAASEPLGRIMGARYEEGSAPGMGFLALLPKITDPDAIEKVLDGRYKTLSIGVSASEAICSVCNQKLISEGLCDHYKGEKYKIRTNSGAVEERECYYILSGIKAREISFVNVPSDDQAQVINTDLGEDGMKKWLGKSGTVKATESVSQKDLAIKKLFEGYLTSESYKELKMENENKVDELDGIESDALPELNTLSQISEAVESLLKDITENKEVRPELKDAVENAVKKAGLSDNHVFRVVLSENTGLPLLESSEENEIKNIINTLFSNEDNKPEWLDKIGVSQVEISVESLVELTSKLVNENVSLKGSNSALETSLTEKDSKVTELTSQLEELSTSTESVLKEEILTLQKEVARYKQEAHLMLATTVAVEMTKNSAPLSKGKTFEELVSLLSKRSDDSLKDTYNDLLASLEVEVAPVSTKVEQVDNPLLSSRKDEADSGDRVLKSLSAIKELLKKNNLITVVDETSKTNEEVIVPVESEREEIELIVSANGMVEASIKDIVNKHIL